MKIVADVLIAALDLLKAEGRAARGAIVAVAIALGVVLAAIAVLVLALVFLFRSMLLAMEVHLGPSLASLITGLICLLVALVMLWVTWLKMKAGRRRDLRR